MINALIAAAEPMALNVPWWAYLIVAVVLFLLIVVMPIMRCYRKCPSNKVLVIYGKVRGGNTARCIHGGASFVVPVFQDYAYLILDPMQIEIPLKGPWATENIRVNVPRVFTFAVG